MNEYMIATTIPGQAIGTGIPGGFFLIARHIAESAGRQPDHLHHGAQHMNQQDTDKCSHQADLIVDNAY